MNKLLRSILASPVTHHVAVALVTTIATAAVKKLDKAGG